MSSNNVTPENPQRLHHDDTPEHFHLVHHRETMRAMNARQPNTIPVQRPFPVSPTHRPRGRNARRSTAPTSEQSTSLDLTRPIMLSTSDAVQHIQGKTGCSDEDLGGVEVDESATTLNATGALVVPAAKRAGPFEQLITTVKSKFSFRNGYTIETGSTAFMSTSWVDKSSGQSLEKKRRMKEMIMENRETVEQFGNKIERALEHLEKVAAKDWEMNEGGARGQLQGGELWKQQKGVEEINAMLKSALKEFGSTDGEDEN